MKFLLFLFIFVIAAPYIGRAISWLLGKIVRRTLEKQADNFYRANGIDPEEMRRKRQEQEKIRKEQEKIRKEQEKVRTEGGWSSPTPKKKKIDPSIAESIKYQEVTIVQETTASQSSQSSQESQESQASQAFATEEQVVDIKWVDIDIKENQT